MNISKETLPKNTLKFTVTIPSEVLAENRAHVIKEIAGNSKVDGFRKGHAPNAIVESKIDEEKVLSEMLNHLLPNVLSEIQKASVTIIIAEPRIKIVKFEVGMDAELSVEVAVRPEVTIGDWRTALKDSKSKDDAVAKIVDFAVLEISDLAVEEETNRALGRLLNQIEKLGITVDAYATSQNKTIDKLKEEYKERAEKSLRLSFILDKLADMEKIEVTEDDIKAAINATPDESLRASLQNDEQKWYIKEVLKRNKVMELIYGSVSPNSN
ncbi:MAG: trigger factor [candidate division WWE3 bacterium]|nr:trigger factor [candidate division WWE3 bacterium]